MVSRETSLPPLKISGGVFTLSVLNLDSADPGRLAQQLAAEERRSPLAMGLLRRAPLVLDLAKLPDGIALDLSAIAQTLRAAELMPAGVRNAAPGHQDAAIAAGLPILRGQEAAQNRPEPERPPAASLVVERPVRAGQRIYARGGDLILLGVVNAGAEVLADGHIHVYAPLRGRALAGVTGNGEARIFCHAMEAELVAVAGVYRVLDRALQQEVQGRPAQVHLQDDELHIEPLSLA